MPRPSSASCRILAAVVVVLALVGLPLRGGAQPAAAAAPDVDHDGGYPREIQTSAGLVTVYQPQLDAWDGTNLKARAALSIREPGSESPLFGAGWFEVRTAVDKVERLVALYDYRLEKLVFPSAPDKTAAYEAVVRNEVFPKTKDIALDRLEAMLEMTEAERGQKAQPVKNDPPQIAFATKPTILAYVDGTPVWRPVKDTRLERVLNTRVLLVRDGDGRHFLHVFDGWLESAALDGPWTVAQKTSGDLKKAVKDAEASGQVDLLPGGNPEDPKTLPKLKHGKVPEILVATRPTELIVFEGEPNYVPIETTQLLYAKNTTGNVFKHIGDQKSYVLVSGRWFRAASDSGPWEFVPNDELPKDFAEMPDDSPKENVKASVAGTAQAKEALIANAIPQTAEVKIAETKIDPPKFDGEPKLVPIEGTELQYVQNTATPIIRVTPTSYYAVQNAVWFTGPALTGPWAVATSVPAVVYTIPPSSPLHYVTYVRIYDTKPDVVYVGYTPGYYGTAVSYNTVVYGTGYYYTPWVGSVWYGPPVTYGCGVGISYTPWTGWTFGFGFGWSWGSVTVGWGWGAYPWWGPVGWGYYSPYPYYRPPYWGGAAWGPRGAAVWGPGGWAATTGNVYSRWGATSAVTRSSGGYNAWTGNSWRGSAGASYNSRTGTLAAGQRAGVANVYTGNYAYGGRGAATNTRTGTSVSGGRVTAGSTRTGNQVSAGRVSGSNPNTGQSGSAGYVSGGSGTVGRVGDDVYAGRDGNVYKRNPGGGWEQQTPGGSWSGVQDRARTSTLESQARARSSGQTRVQNYGGSRAAGARARGGGRRR